MGARTYNLNICKASPWYPETRWGEKGLTAVNENYAVLNQNIIQKGKFTQADHHADNLPTRRRLA